MSSAPNNPTSADSGHLPEEIVVDPHPSGESYPVLPLAPGEDGSTFQQRLYLASLPDQPAPPPAIVERPQFSLKGILMLTLGAALALGLLKAVAHDITPRGLAAMSGLLATIGIGISAVFRPWFALRMVWWSLVAVYVIAGAISVILG